MPATPAGHSRRGVAGRQRPEFGVRVTGHWFVGLLEGAPVALACADRYGRIALVTAVTDGSASPGSLASAILRSGAVRRPPA
jgi:hypothetical protein